MTIEPLAPPFELADRIKIYLDDAPQYGEHSDKAGANCWELLREAEDELRYTADHIELLEVVLREIADMEIIGPAAQLMQRKALAALTLEKNNLHPFKKCDRINSIREGNMNVYEVLMNVNLARMALEENDPSKADDILLAIEERLHREYPSALQTEKLNDE